MKNRGASRDHISGVKSFAMPPPQHRAVSMVVWQPFPCGKHWCVAVCKVSHSEYQTHGGKEYVQLMSLASYRDMLQVVVQKSSLPQSAKSPNENALAASSRMPPPSSLSSSLSEPELSLSLIALSTILSTDPSSSLLPSIEV